LFFKKIKFYKFFIKYYFYPKKYKIKINYLFPKIIEKIGNVHPAATAEILPISYKKNLLSN